MSRPALSVVVPTRDTRELTARCLASLERLGEHELVVVDDGSTDGTTEELCPRFPDAVWLRSERPGGFTLAANQGLASASGELLLLLNSDTEIREGTAEGLVRRFESEPRLGAGGARLTHPDGSPQWSGGREPTLTWLFLLASGLGRAAGGLSIYRRLRPVSGTDGKGVDWVPGTALVLRREAWAACGPFDDAYRFYAQDLDLATRMRAAEWRVAVLDELEVLHHLGATVVRSEQGHDGQRTDWLWRDLLTWAERHRGAAWTRRARRILRRGARLRAAALALGTAVTRGERRAAARAERAALGRALAALDRPAHDPALP